MVAADFGRGSHQTVEVFRGPKSDSRQLNGLRTSSTKISGHRGRLRVSPGNHDAATKQGPILEPGQIEGCHLADHNGGGRLGLQVGQGGHGGPQRALVGASTPLHRRRGRVGGRTGGDQPLADGAAAGRAHEYHHRAAQGGNGFPVDRSLPFGRIFVTGDHGERCGGIAHGQGDPGIGGHSHCRRDAGDHLEGDPCRGQHSGLLAPPGEDEGVTTLEAHHLLPSSAPLHQQGIDVLLRGSGPAGLFAHGDALGIFRGQIEEAGHRQPVVDHHISISQHLGTPQGQKRGITRPSAYQIDRHLTAQTGLHAITHTIIWLLLLAVDEPIPVPAPPHRHPRQPPHGNGRRGRRPAQPAWPTSCPG